MEAAQSTTSHHGAILHPSVKELHSKLTILGSNEDLLQILIKKGLTTPVQWYFIGREVETLHQLADMLTTKFNALVKGCEMIIEEQR